MAIVIETLQQYADAGYVLHLDCARCGRRPRTLAEICALGHGNTAMPDFRPTCAKCGERLQKIVEPPQNQGGRPSYLLQPQPVQKS